MKKLFFGLMLAICTLVFSAFTTKQSNVLTNYWALLSDGNYHRLASYDEFENCQANTGTYCVVLWTYSGGVPATNVMPAAAMAQFINDGLAAYQGTPYFKYLP